MAIRLEVYICTSCTSAGEVSNPLIQGEVNCQLIYMNILHQQNLHPLTSGGKVLNLLIRGEVLNPLIQGEVLNPLIREVNCQLIYMKTYFINIIQGVCSMW